MRSTLIALMLFCGATPVLAQAPTELQSETVAAVTTRSGEVRQICIKPERGDDRPGTGHMLVKDGETTLVAIPDDPGQAGALTELLDACSQNNIEVTISGPMVRYSNRFGQTTLLHLKRIELRLRDPNLRLSQIIIITVED